MSARKKARTVLSLAASWGALAAILACGGGDGGGGSSSTSLAPGFTPAVTTVEGEGGGIMTLSTRARNASGCQRGFIGAVSDHRINVTRDLSYLRILAAPRGGAQPVINTRTDLVLAIKMADNTWRCNDDGLGTLNPMIEGSFPRGNHQIFVGTLERGGTVDFTLGFTEDRNQTHAAVGGTAGPAGATPPAGGTAPAAGGTAPAGGGTAPAAGGTAPAAGGAPGAGRVPPGQPFNVRQGFAPDPMISTGTAGGPQQASDLSPACRGYVGAAAHTLNVTGTIPVLSIAVNSAEDTTLAVRGPGPQGQVRCDDDSEGYNPRVTGSFGPGVYQIFVGSYDSGQRPSYTIGVSANPNLSPRTLR